MTMDELRAQFRRGEESETKHAKLACKAMILAELSRKLYRPLLSLPDATDEPGEDCSSYREMVRLRTLELQMKNIRRAVLLADRICEAAFGGLSDGELPGAEQC